jgi:hypothetical protein
MAADSDGFLDLNLFITEPSTATLRTDEEKAMWERESSGFVINVCWKWAIHGKFSIQDPSPASLLVFYVKLANKDNSTYRRYKTFKLELRFEKSPKGDPCDDPYINYFAPAKDGKVYLDESIEKQKNTTTKEASVDAGTTEAKVRGAIKNERGTEKDMTFHTSVEALSQMSGWKGRQGKDTVWWNLKENNSQKSGVVDTFGIAVLIKRPTDENFKVVSDMKATIDFRYSIRDKLRQLTGTAEKPFEFSPAIDGKPQKKPEGLNEDDLEQFADSGKLEALAFLHLPEIIQPHKFYASKAVPTT